MAEEKQGRAGHNGGGSLKTGNTVNVGRKPNEVRQKYLNGADEFGDWIQKVAKGEKCIEVPALDPKPNAKRVFRAPTFNERKEAGEICAKYGLGTKMDVTTDDQPLPKAYINVDIERVVSGGSEPPNTEA